MAIVLKDRVKETSTTTGTSDFVLGGAVGGFQSFAAVGDGNITYYAAVDPATGAWEVGKGTYSTTGPTLTRDTIYESSNAGAKIVFGAGPKDVFVTYPAERAIFEEPDGQTLIDGGPITVLGNGVTSNPSLEAELGKFVGNVDSFGQVYNMNQNDGSSASADFVVYNDLTTDGFTNFTDMGINSSNYSSVDYPIFTPGSGYFFHDGDHLFIGTQTASKDVVLFAGGVDTTNEAVRIKGADQAVELASDLSVAGTQTVTGAAEFQSTVLLNANPTTALQAATKQYVDNQVTAGLHIHDPVLVETTGNLTATYVQGGTTFNITDITSTTTVTTSVNHGLSVNDQIWLYNTAGNGLATNTAYFVYSVPAANQLTLSLTYNGAQVTGLTNASGLTYNTRANSGVGATLTNSGAQAALSIDGVAMSTNDRVMVRLQTTGYENGVYVVTTVGSGSTNWVLTRATDANQVNPADPNGLGTGDYFYTQSGTLNAGDSHVLTTEPNTMIIGYTTLTYTQFSGSVDYTGGTNIDITGQVISLTGTVAATNGGTGTGTVTTGDLLYGSGTNAWSKLAAGSAYKSLVMNGSGTNVEWNAVALNQSGSVSGALPATNGGTGQSSYATGDMLYSDASNSLTKLSGNTSTTKKFLGQTGTGSASQAPVWEQPAASDITGLAPSATTDTTNASNITSGTLPTGRLTGSYTGITGVGTLAAGTWNADAIGATYGGTGNTSYAVGDLLYADTTTSLAKLADVATGNALISGGVGSAPSWGKVGLATHVSGTLPIANGGTNGSASPAAGAVAYGTGTAYDFTSVGTSGQVLTSAGTSAPTWTSQSSISVGTATNIAGGAANQVLYQSASGTTAFVTAPTTSGTALTWDGSAFTWQTAGSATLQNDVSTNTTYYPVFATATSGSFTDARVANTKLTFNPNTGTLSATTFSGAISSSMVTTALGYTPYNAGANTVLTSANYSSYAIPISGGINMTGSFGLNDAKLYLRTNGDTNHYLWNAGDDWEELVAYAGTGYRIKSSTGTTLETWSTGAINSYIPTYITSSNGQVLTVTKSGSAPGNNSTFMVVNTYGNHSWGITGEFRIENNSGADRPSILFSSGYNSNTWSVGYGYSDDNFRINQDHGWRNGAWGTPRFSIDRNGTLYNGNLSNVIVTQNNYSSYVSAMGVGQSWQDVTSSRSGNTNYTNSTGKPILVWVVMGYGDLALLIGSDLIWFFSQGGSARAMMTVPPGATYQASFAGGRYFNKWLEYR